jgi:cyanate permease
MRNNGLLFTQMQSQMVCLIRNFVPNILIKLQVGARSSVIFLALWQMLSIWELCLSQSTMIHARKRIGNLDCLADNSDFHLTSRLELGLCERRMEA